MFAPPVFSAAGSFTALLRRGTVPVGSVTVATPRTTIPGMCISAHLFPFSVFIYINALGASSARIKRIPALIQINTSVFTVCCRLIFNLFFCRSGAIYLLYNNVSFHSRTTIIYMISHSIAEINLSLTFFSDDFCLLGAIWVICYLISFTSRTPSLIVYVISSEKQVQPEIFFRSRTIFLISRPHITVSVGILVYLLPNPAEEAISRNLWQR